MNFLSDDVMTFRRNSSYPWPSHYDFFLPYGTKDGGLFYAKPGYNSVNLPGGGGLLKLKALNCFGSTYRFGVSQAATSWRSNLTRAPAMSSRTSSFREPPSPGPIGIVTIREGKAP